MFSRGIRAPPPVVKIRPIPLTDRLRLPVQLANPIEKLQVADGVLDMMVIDEVAPLLMLPIGLALRSAA